MNDLMQALLVFLSTAGIFIGLFLLWVTVLTFKILIAIVILKMIFKGEK